MGAAEVEQFLTHFATDRSEEMRLVPVRLDDEQAMMAGLLNCAGLRLMACTRLPVKDVDFFHKLIVVRHGKGGKVRAMMLPARLVELLQRQRRRVTAIHGQNLREGFEEVYLPHALARKYPRAGLELGWQYIFPASQRPLDTRSGRARDATREGVTAGRESRGRNG